MIPTFFVLIYFSCEGSQGWRKGYSSAWRFWKILLTLYAEECSGDCSRTGVQVLPVIWKLLAAGL